MGNLEGEVFYLARFDSTGKVVAYKCSENWIEVRRNRDESNYSGPERRVIIPFS
jgi:hypothetical protein